VTSILVFLASVASLVFLNVLLTRLCLKRLQDKGFTVLHHQQVLGDFTLALHPPGSYAVAQIGASDFVFFALFTAAAVRLGLRARLTWVAMTASLGVTMTLSYAFDSALPALPLLSLAFIGGCASASGTNATPESGTMRVTGVGDLRMTAIDQTTDVKVDFPVGKVWHALPAAQQAVIQADIQDAFRAAFLTMAVFTTAGFFLALTNPLRRI